MKKQYEYILNMTNEEAASIISNFMCTKVFARGSCKPIMELRMIMAFSEAVDALIASPEKPGLEVLAGALTRNEMTPNMVRGIIGLEPLVDISSFISNGGCGYFYIDKAKADDIKKGIIKEVKQ